MRLKSSTTVTLLGLVGVVLGAVGLLSLGLLVGAGALGFVLVVALVGLWLERGGDLEGPLRLRPVKISEADAIYCGVDETAPWLLERTSATDGQRLLRFVPRAAARKMSGELAEAVMARRSVALGLLGESKAGKTRCMFELMRAGVPNALLFAPRGGPDAVREVIRMRRFRSRRRWTVLWLDDLDRFIDPRGDGVDDGLLDEVLALPRVVVAITAGKQLGIVRLEHAPTLARLIPGDSADGQRIAKVLGQQLADAIGDEGLGAACVAAGALLDIHRDAKHPNVEGGRAVPEGQIVVECLIAAAQLGLGALTRDQLLGVYHQTGTGHASAESFDRGLRWATAALHGEVALALSDNDAFHAYEYLVEHARPVGGYRSRAEHALAARMAVEDLIVIAGHARDVSDPARALRLFELALARTPERQHQADVIAMIGLVQRDLARFKDARASQQRVLAIKEADYGAQHPEVARTLSNLGNVQQDLGELKAARVALQRAVAIFEAVYGPEHPEVALALGNLGNVQEQLGELEAARASQERALAIKEDACGREHPDVAVTLTNLGSVQGRLGELDLALASQERALAIFEAVYGREHPQVAGTLTNLGVVQRQLGKPAAARTSQQRALAIKEAVYGPEHPEVALALGNLGIVGSQLGEFEVARGSLQRALAIFEAVYGVDHLEIARTLGNLGIVQHELGELEAAEANTRRALAIFETDLTNDHPDTRWARRQLAYLVAVRGEVLLNVRDNDPELVDPDTTVT